MRRGIIAADNGGWSPARLYAGDGDYYLGDDLSRVFQEPAKSTPSANNGDVIGAAVGQLGVGPDLTQATGANKLLLYVGGGETAFRMPNGVDCWLIGTLPASIAYTDDVTLWAITREVIAGGTQSQFVPALRDSNNPVASTRQRLGPQENVSAGICGRGWVRTAASPATNSATVSTFTQYKLMALKRTDSGTAGILYTGTNKVAANIGTATVAQNAITIDSNGVMNGEIHIAAFGYLLRGVTDAEMAKFSTWAARRYGAQF